MSARVPVAAAVCATSLVWLWLGACGPAPSQTDAAVLVLPRDGSSFPDGSAVDTASADSGAPDSRSSDAGLPDGSSAADGAGVDAQGGSDAAGVDSAAADSNLADSAAQDSAQPDSAAPDSAQPDAYEPDSAEVFYGPYMAPGLPRTIADADTGNVAQSTDSLIYVPWDLPVSYVDVHFEIAHADAHDLQVRLIPPIGATTQLFDGDTCASGTCANPLVKDILLIPVQSTTLGNWVLRITDRFETQTGMLQSFTVTFLP